MEVEGIANKVSIGRLTTYWVKYAKRREFLVLAGQMVWPTTIATLRGTVRQMRSHLTAEVGS
jgi:hypothetical protein